MPRIQEYRQQSRGGVSAPTGQMQASGVSGLAESLKIIGKTVNNITDEYDRVQEKNAIYNVEKATVAEQTELTEYWNNKKSSIKGNGEGFTESVVTDLEKRKSEKLSSIESPRERELLSMKYDRLYNGVIQDAMGYQTSTAANYEVSSLQSQFETRRNQVRNEPSLAEKYEPENDSLIDSNIYLDASVKTKLKEEEKRALYDTALDGYVTKLETSDKVSSGDIAALRKELTAKDSNKWTGKASAQGYDNALRRLDRLKETFNAREKQDYMNNFKQEMAFMKDGNGFDRGKYTEKEIMSSPYLSDKEKQRMVQEQYFSRTIGNEARLIKDLPADQIENSLSPDFIKKEIQSNPDNYFLIKEKIDARQAAWKEREKQYNDDPVSYIKGVSPAVSKLGDALNSVLQNDLQLKDLNTAVPLADKYASTVISEQKRLYPNKVPTILDQGRINQIKYQMTNIVSSPKGVDEAFVALKKESVLWGKYSDIAFKDLRNGGAINASQAVAASLVADTSKEYLAKDLLKASVTPLKDMKSDESEDRVRDMVREELSSFRQTLDPQADGQKIYQDLEDSSTQLYMYYKTSNNPDRADIKEITKDIILNDYNINGSYRVPKTFDVDLVESSSNMFIDSLPEIKNIYVPPSKTGLNPEDSKDLYIRSIQNSGKWVNYGDEGVMLLDHNNENVFTIENGKEEPIIMRWENMGPYKQLKEKERLKRIYDTAQLPPQAKGKK